MTAPHTLQEDITASLNHARRGATYRITTPKSPPSANTLAPKAPTATRPSLLRQAKGTDSIPLHQITSISDSVECASLRAVS